MISHKTRIINCLVRKFRRLGIWGWQRFRLTKLIYSLMRSANPRKGELDFILQYLPILETSHRNKLKVIDIGCTESLLMYELKKRGYLVSGLDQRYYQEPLPLDIFFFRHDITETPPKTLRKRFDYVVAVSTIEHIGMGAYGDRLVSHGDKMAIWNISQLLKPHGLLIMTVPLWYWQDKGQKGYTYQSFKRLVAGFFDIQEITVRNGQLCVCLTRY